MLPGNHSGLSGSAAAQTATDLELEGAANLLTLSFLPPKNEALVAPTTDPFFCELGEEKTAAMADEAQAEAIVCRWLVGACVCVCLGNES